MDQTNGRVAQTNPGSMREMKERPPGREGNRGAQQDGTRSLQLSPLVPGLGRKRGLGQQAGIYDVDVEVISRLVPLPFIRRFDVPVGRGGKVRSARSIRRKECSK